MDLLCVRFLCCTLPFLFQRTSISVNIKERLDFSCAVFDSSGGLVANAPHLPVHLGAMQEAVRLVAAACSMTLGASYRRLLQFSPSATRSSPPASP